MYATWRPSAESAFFLPSSYPPMMNVVQSTKKWGFSLLLFLFFSFSLSFHRLLILKKTPNWSFSFHSIFSSVLNIFLILYLLSNRIESIRFLFTSFCIRTEEDIFARDFSYSILALLCRVDPRRSGWLFSYPTTGESIFPIIGKSVRLPCVLYNALR